MGAGFSDTAPNLKPFEPSGPDERKDGVVVQRRRKAWRPRGPLEIEPAPRMVCRGLLEIWCALALLTFPLAFVYNVVCLAFFGHLTRVPGVALAVAILALTFGAVLWPFVLLTPRDHVPLAPAPDPTPGPQRASAHGEPDAGTWPHIGPPPRADGDAGRS